MDREAERIGWSPSTNGDTVCVRERTGRAKVVGQAGWPFLGPGAGVPPVKRVRLRRSDRVAVASDGLTPYLGRDWAARTAEPLATAEDAVAGARHLVDCAMDGGAGDNVAQTDRVGCGCRRSRGSRWD